MECLQVLYPWQLSMRTILGVIDAGIDKDIYPAVECKHIIVEVSPVDVLFRSDCVVDSLVSALENGILS